MHKIYNKTITVSLTHVLWNDEDWHFCPREWGLLQRELSFVNKVSDGLFNLNAVLYVLG